MIFLKDCTIEIRDPPELNAEFADEAVAISGSVLSSIGKAASITMNTELNPFTRMRMRHNIEIYQKRRLLFKPKIIYWKYKGRWKFY